MGKVREIDGDQEQFWRMAIETWRAGGLSVRQFCKQEGLRPHEAMRLAGHSDLNTTMTYYVGIRQSIIDRARQASRTNLALIDPCNFRANSVRAAKIGQEAK